MVRSVFANVHQGCNIFQPFNGVQCTAIALIALVTFMQYMPYISNMSSSVLDQIVFDGTDLYRHILARGAGNIHGYLSHRELPSNLRDWNDNYGEVRYFFDMFYGPVNSQVLIDRNTGSMTFHEAFLEGINLSSYFFITLQDSTVAVYYDSMNGRVNLFDSHQRNSIGLPDPNGSAILLTFSSVDEFLQYITTIYLPYQYEMTPIHFNWFPSNISQQNLQNSGINDKNFKIFKPCTNVNESENQETNSSNGSGTCLNFHTYCKKGKSLKKKKKKFARNASSYNISDQFLNEGLPFNYIDTQNFEDDNNDFLPSIVSECCVVNCSVVKESYTDIILNKKHISDYEYAIRESPETHCFSCERFLFKRQIHYLHENTSIAGFQFKKTGYCQLCFSSIKKKTLPYLSCEGNDLKVYESPEELKKLSTLEKRLIALVQVFMTLVVLPGGQYAEKGLVLNLPSDVQNVANQLPIKSAYSAMVGVKFIDDKHVSDDDIKYFASPLKVFQALKWLKKHNILYSDVNIDMEEMMHDKLFDSSRSNEVFDVDSFTLTPMNSSLPNINIQDFITKGYIEIPRIEQKPVNIYDMKTGEEMAFPWLFPHGINGYNFPRHTPIPRAMYFRQRLYHKSGSFRKNMTYLLHSAVNVDLALLKSEININMRMTKSLTEDKYITASDVRNFQHNMTLCQNSYMFMKNIRGTVAYFRNQLYNLLAMFKCIGPPTLFMTLSADDLHWTELGMLLQEVNYEAAQQRNSFTENMRKDPLMTAIHFERRFDALMKHIILSGPEPLGKVLDYFARVEFQNRGSPHIHVFLDKGCSK